MLTLVEHVSTMSRALVQNAEALAREVPRLVTLDRLLTEYDEREVLH